MNDVIKSTINIIHNSCDKMNITTITGGILPYYLQINKNGYLPVADMYVESDNINTLYEELLKIFNDGMEVTIYSTEFGNALCISNLNTTFIDFSDIENQLSFGIHVNILPVQHNDAGISFSNANRERIVFKTDFFKDTITKEHNGIMITIPADTKPFYDILYRDGTETKHREYLFSNCVFDEKIAFTSLDIDIKSVLDHANSLKNKIEDNRSLYLREKALCDDIFDEVQRLFSD